MIRLPDGRSAGYLTEASAPPPMAVVPIDDQTRANDALRSLRAGEALVWTGDWRNGRHLLGALRRRLDKRRDPPAADLAARWRAQRAATRERGELLGGVLVVVEPDGTVALPRAPDTRTAVELAWGPSTEPRLVALNTLLGALSAAEWTRRGLDVPGLQGRLVPRFGVFAPTRRAYVDLLAHLDVEGKTVLDVGCGTGVLAFVLLQRGARSAVGTDLDPRAVDCATDNAARLGLDHRFRAVQADLFVPAERSDRVVFNAPWVPETPRTRLDRAVFDEGGATLRRFLAGLPEHLTDQGTGGLLLSDLPERLGLRAPGDLEREVGQAGLRVVHTAEVAAAHRRAGDPRDPLHAVRSQERVRLWVLAR
jgi:SAM-dependent methyltransferase